MTSNNKNEVKKFAELSKEVSYLAEQYEGKPSPVVDIPPNIFSEFQKRRKKIQEQNVVDSLDNY